MEQEIWKDIPGYEGLYQVSNLGRVKSLKKRRVSEERILGGWLQNKRPSVNLYGRDYKIYRLVASAFLGMELECKKFTKDTIIVCHKDDNPLNNRLDNLFLGKPKDNTQDMIEKGRDVFNKKVVLQYTLEGELIKEWESIRIAQNMVGLGKRIHISECCSGKLRKSGGFMWRYK